MDKLGIKATLYDILGYGLPGALLILGVYSCLLPVGSIDLLMLSQIKISIPFGILCTGIFYLAGYFLSSLSSFLFENKLTKKITSKFYDFDTTKYNTKSMLLFGLNYSDCGIRTQISYCQHHYPFIYETAFSFLTIYGLSRNSATALIIIFPFIFNIISLIWLIAYLIVVIFLIHNYLRFMKYYIHQIASSIMISNP